VAHQQFLQTPGPEFLKKVVKRGCLIDVKAALDADAFRREGLTVWRL
jgi:UDP-N-acetyl-D-galactosamine dehydrogenase